MYLNQGLPPAPPLPSGSFACQIVIWYGTPPTQHIYEGVATQNPDGTWSIIVTIDPTPPSGSAVQILIYNNGTGDPTLIEGTTGSPDGDGNIPVYITTSGGSGGD